MFDRVIGFDGWNGATDGFTGLAVGTFANGELGKGFVLLTVKANSPVGDVVGS